MAGVPGAATIAAVSTTTSPFQPAAPSTGKTRVISSSSSLPSSFPSRYRRTNHLRKKILKNLENKPYLDTNQDSKFPAKIPSISIEETAQKQITEFDQLSLSETTGFVDGVLGTFSLKSAVKIGLFLVGAFVFQTVCAVLIFGSSDLEDEDEILSSDGDNKKARVKNKLKSKPDLSLIENRGFMETKEGGIVVVDESEMDNRIVEIQEMAREARLQEKIEGKRKGLVEESDDVVDFDLVDKTVKEKEVDGRLMKLRKSLERNYQKPTPKFPRKEGDVSDNGDKGEAFGSLMFKKKYKYKSPSIDSGDKPKGFDGNVGNETLINGVAADDGTLQTDRKNDGFDRLDNSEQINGNESEIKVTSDDNKNQEPRATKTESVAGTTKEYDKQAGRAVKSGITSNVETRKPRGFGKESNDYATKNDDSNRNGSLKGKKGGNRKPARNLGDMKSSSETGFWWTCLPYVMAVLMQRGGNSEESEGLFTLRSNSQTENSLSHTVAFEDRGDATNFSYLLEYFFEDLGDFSTNIIPIPTNELEEAIKSKIMKVVVVKKGQLQLYVGQPLEDVESALRTLIDQGNKL